MSSVGKAASNDRRLRRLAESIQRHEEAIASERRAAVAAVARIAERRVRVKRLRELQGGLVSGRGNEPLAVQALQQTAGTD